jgi:ABC-type lipoprotein release transport system permease subunit
MCKNFDFVYDLAKVQNQSAKNYQKRKTTFKMLLKIEKKIHMMIFFLIFEWKISNWHLVDLFSLNNFFFACGIIKRFP